MTNMQNVDLVGVVQGGVVTYLSGRTKELKIQPSAERVDFVMQYPRGTRIGLEWFESGVLRRVEENMQNAAKKEGLVDAKFPDEGVRYWERFLQVCEARGFEVEFLESEELWKKYNKKAAASFKAERDLRMHYEDERLLSEMELFRDVALENAMDEEDVPSIASKRDEREEFVNERKLREAAYRAEVQARRIHELERDQTLLEAIRAKNVRVAICGVGHTDYWMAQREQILKKESVQFGAYAKDVLPLEVEDIRKWRPQFTANARPERSILEPRERLERMVHFVEQGTYAIGKKAHYVGLWDMNTPARGYFEVFVNTVQGDGTFSGTIEDCIGSARVRGEVSSDGIRFKKLYLHHRGGDPSARGEIEYASERQGNDFYGRFSSEDTYGDFMMTKAAQENPLVLATRWFDAVRSKG